MGSTRFLLANEACKEEVRDAAVQSHFELRVGLNFGDKPFHRFREITSWDPPSECQSTAGRTRERMINKELPWDRLATSDAKGNRIYLYLTETYGKWNKRRSRLSSILIIVFLGLPWVRVGGHQALLFDIPKRRFSIFGLTFWAHDLPLLFFVVGGAVISIAFITAIWGRFWCGWACPQTIFVEQVFRRAERWIEGDALARKSLDEAPLGFKKLFKKMTKWGIFSLLAMLLSHSFLAYFFSRQSSNTLTSAS